MSLLKELEERPLQEPGKQLTAAFFILACLGKTYQISQSPQSMANSLIRIFILKPDLENRSCPDYEFLRGCLGKRYVMVNHGNDYHITEILMDPIFKDKLLLICKIWSMKYYYVRLCNGHDCVHCQKI